MPHPSPKNTDKSGSVLYRQNAGAQIDRIGTLLLEKKCLEMKRPGAGDEGVCNFNASPNSKRQKGIDESMLALFSAQDDQNSLGTRENSPSVVDTTVNNEAKQEQSSPLIQFFLYDVAK
ncbi:unnamed protein product [Gongylonema pulchrum]|uniref:Uncharacterized protein n=1 Tax=Gongylonema pulchrum TaxID=637853 RepID=A0A183DJM2_9BILA|nr:unnamed protein product [Gongylonema pulchrum]